MTLHVTRQEKDGGVYPFVAYLEPKNAYRLGVIFVAINQLEASYTVKLTMDKPMTTTQLESLNGGVEVVQSRELSRKLGEPQKQAEDDVVSENTYLLRLANSPSALRGMLDEIAKAGLGLENLQITPVTLEDVFLELTGTELRD
jgi:hypothetical protein